MSEQWDKISAQLKLGVEMKRQESEKTRSQARILRDAAEVLSKELPYQPSISFLEKVTHAETFLKTALLVRIAEDAGALLPAIIPQNETELRAAKIDNQILKNLDLGGKEDVVVQKMYLEAAQRRLVYLQECLSISHDMGLSISDMKKRLIDLRRYQKNNINKIVPTEIPQALRKFSDGLRDRLAEATQSVELNTGCSVGCSFCAYSAEKTVSDSLPFSEAAWCAMHVGSRAFFYSATDPLDYSSPDGGKDYADLLVVRESALGELPYTSTAYPRGKSEVLKKMGDRISRLSVSYMNYRRLEADGFIIYQNGRPTFTDPDLADAVYFGGTSRIARIFDNQQEEASLNFSVNFDQKLGECFRQAPEEQGFYNFSDPKSPSKISGRQRDVLSKLAKDSSLPAFAGSIHCAQGIMITPSEILNTIPMFATEENKNGKIVQVLTPELLAHGEEEVKKLYENFQQSKGVLGVAELLKHGIVQYAFGSNAIYMTGPESLKGRHVLPPGDNIQARMKLMRPMTEDDLTQTLNLNTYNENGQLLGSWRCVYNQITGEIKELAPEPQSS